MALSTEALLYPNPLAERAPRVLVTTRRVIVCGDLGPREIAKDEIRFVGCLSLRPLAPFGVVVALLGLPIGVIARLSGGLIGFVVSALALLFLIGGLGMIALRRREVVVSGNSELLQICANGLREQRRLFAAIEILRSGESVMVDDVRNDQVSVAEIAQSISA